jgi:VWFA-related protein
MAVHAMTSPSLRSLLPVCAAALAAGSLAPAAETPAGFVASVDVELVTVHVWVSDRQGRPVSGLAAKDFALEHDGKPVAITHFAELRRGAVAPDAAAAAPAAAPEPGAAPAAAPGYLVLYFDQLHLRPRDYGPLVDGIRKLLAADAVAPERVLVLRQDRELHLEVPIGSTREALEAGLLRVAAAHGIDESAAGDQFLANLNLAWQESTELSDSRNRGVAAMPGGERSTAGGPREAVGSTGGLGSSGMGPNACEMFVRRVQGSVEALAHERSTRTAMTVRHLHQAGAMLAGLPGMKTLVYLSDGLEPEPASPVHAAVGTLCPGQSLDFAPPEMRLDLVALTRHLNTNQVTVHAMQASGLRVADSTTAGARTLAMGTRAGQVASAFESAQRTSQRRGMALLTDETGGRLVVNQNDFGPELAEVAGDLGSYYSLGYAPPPGPAGGGAGEHRIAVELADGSLQARYRRGYREKDAEQRLRESLEGVLYLGVTANPLEVRLGAADVRPRGDKFVLPLHAFVPVERLAFLGSPEAAVAELRLQVLARNAGSQREEWKGKAFRVRRPAGLPEGTGAAADLGIELELDRGTHVVAVALRDEVARTTSLVSTTLDVGR